MPLYEYENPETGEVIEVFQEINDEHTYFQGGTQWRRVWSHTFSLSSNIDPFDPQAFVRKTGEGKMTMGDITDLSKELSIKRLEQAGRDEVKEKARADYAAQRRGKTFGFDD